MSLLLKAGSPWVLVLGASVAIASKFFLRIDGKHVFNPGNLGIAAAVLLTGDAWVSPGQWGSGAALVFLVGAAGCMVVLRVGPVSYTHLRAHETVINLVCRLLLEKQKHFSSDHMIHKL